MRDRRAMYESEVERLAGEQARDASSKASRVEVSDGRRRHRGQSRDHARRLYGIANRHHLEPAAMLAQALSLLRFRVGTDEGRDGDLVRPVQMSNHVERTDLAAALGREREAVTDVEDLHAAIFN